MEKIVITGRGLVTPLGNGLKSNEDCLRKGVSGITLVEEWRDMGLESQVAGMSDENPENPLINHKNKRFTTPNSRMAIAATYEALLEAGFDVEELKNKRVLLILGCAGSAYSIIYEGAKAFVEHRKIKRVSPFIVPKVMPSSAVANLSLILGIKGESFDISSACSSSTHAIMMSCRLLQNDEYDIAITGGAEELNWVHALGFNAMRALSTKYNDTPEQASRPFDRDRDGFVIASGAGIVILEKESHARKRGAKIISVVSGKASNSNATNMVVPDVSSSTEVMANAIKSAGLTPEDIDYVNTHGTSTPTGDPAELSAIANLFGERASSVPLNSTKSMTGHMIGATGAIETIYCTIMQERGFICPSLNVHNVDTGFEWADIVKELREPVEIKHALTNSFGFGGTNACLILSKPGV